MSSLFQVAHATHPDWRAALALACAQLPTHFPTELPPSSSPGAALGFVYITDHFSAQAEALLLALQDRWPAVAWVGAVGIGVCANGVEYFDEPGLVLMLATLPAEQFEVFSGAKPLARIKPFSALVHADAATHDLDELILEMSQRTESHYLFGGLASSRQGGFHIADGIWRGGLSGVAFSADVALVSRVTQGCQPTGMQRRVTKAERNVVVELDGLSALGCLLSDLGIANLDNPRAVMPRLQATLVGLSGANDLLFERGGQFGADTKVRHLIGLDPARQAVAVADVVEPGMRLAFCQRDVHAARRDLVRICSEIRDELAPVDDTAPVTKRILGAHYVSCTGRGGPHFGGPSAELKIIQHALGDVPLAGFFAAGEITRHHLVGYTGVLTVFVGDL